VVFVPKAEDYGFVTVEAFASAKAVITATDSGGPLDLVKDGVNGLVVEPKPEALASAMARLADSVDEAARLGQQARKDTAHLTWASAVARLTAGLTRG
jgi:glycosyltransferase involved in cell wall biosynthesis